MTFDEYVGRYKYAIDQIKNEFEVLELNQNNLESPETLSALSIFLGFKLKLN
jgi:hypothetical protein